MASHWEHLTDLARSIRNLPHRERGSDEADLYCQRARLAASEERFDVAAVFCRKALEAAPDHLGARFLAAWLAEAADENLDAAIEGYRKVIALAGYESANPYRVAARDALSRLVRRVTEPGAGRAG
jgi:lipopolysaccharide biosynthesis regulator YciM